MGRIGRGDLKKTVYYVKRNGILKTWSAARERLWEKKQSPYVWEPPAPKELEAQREHWRRAGVGPTFSILVPAYRTDEGHLKEMILSLCRQTYPGWELILADATEGDGLESVVRSVWDGRIRYMRLPENAGIAANTNRALELAWGDYVGLLDHDDVLADNALHEMALRILQERRRGVEPELLYSDEDKCSGDGREFFDPHLKEDFNLDLLLSNNYICHFLVMKRELMQELKLRPEFDGAQDYDLVLRGAGALLGREETVCHVPRVLYHWRCHAASTAENPGSKAYAYEAGRRAVEDFVRCRGWKALVEETEHVGFYALRYQGNLFDSRQDVGAVGGRILRRGRTFSGRLLEEGLPMYKGLPRDWSGPLHRAVLGQDAAAVDIRRIRVREECREMFRQIVGVEYRTLGDGETFDASLLPRGCDPVRLSLELCRALGQAGYRILYLPCEESSGRRHIQKEDSREPSGEKTDSSQGPS